MRFAVFFLSFVFPPWLLGNSEKRQYLKVISSLEVLERRLQVFEMRWLELESESEFESGD